MSKFDSMGKEELRKACKAAGIAYGKLNNDGMRAALKSKEAPAPAPAPTPKAQKPEVKTQPAPAAQKTDETVPAGPREKVVGEVVQAKSLKIEKNREARNGVKRPSVGSICREVWDALDASRSKTKEVPTFENVRDLMKAHNWQRNTAFTQYQRWKQFHGVMPRTTDEESDE
jgi:hypothetical protein